MARSLAMNVAVDGQWYGPSYPGNAVPSEVAERITNPKAWGETEAPATADEDGPAPPPQGGKGSGREAWAKYAEDLGVTVDAEAERSEIIDAVQAAGKRVE